MASLRTRRELPHASLGKRRRQPFSYSPRLLEAIPLAGGRRFACGAPLVSLLCRRFTSLCPVTGQPDWADLTISYLPDRLLVESKSLKEYLTSFRQHGDFHEDVVRVVCDDLVRLLAPRYLEVIGRFDSRGSVAIWPCAQFARPDDAEAADMLRHRRLGFAPGAWTGPAPQPG